MNLHTIALLAERLREARVNRRLTQTELGKRAGRSPSGIAAIENGHARPSLELFCRLCAALDVSADYLLGATPPLELPRPGGAQ